DFHVTGVQTCALPILLTWRRQSGRAGLMAAALPAGMAAFFANGDPWGLALAFPLINIAESALAYHLLRMACGSRVVFARVWVLRSEGRRVGRQGRSRV